MTRISSYAPKVDEQSLARREVKLNDASRVLKSSNLASLTHFKNPTSGHSIPPTVSKTRMATPLGALDSMSAQPRSLSKGQRDFVFNSVASGTSDAPVQLLRGHPHGQGGDPQSVATAVAGATFLRTAIIHPFVPLPLKAVGILGIGALAMGNLVKQHFPATAQVEVSPLLGRPPGSTGGQWVYPEERRNESHEIPPHHGIDPTEPGGGLEGRGRLTLDSLLDTHSGGSNPPTELGQVGGREAMNPPEKGGNILLSEGGSGGKPPKDPKLDQLLEDSIRYAQNAVRLAINEASEVPLEKVRDDMEFQRTQDDLYRLTDVFHYKPKINVVGEQVDVLRALNLTRDDYGVMGVYEKKNSVELNEFADVLYLDVLADASRHDLARTFGREAMLVKAALESIKERHGSYPETIDLTLPEWQSGRMDREFGEAQAFKDSLGGVSLEHYVALVNKKNALRTSELAQFQNFMDGIHSNPIVGREGLLSKLGYDFYYFLINDEMASGNSVVLTNPSLIRARESGGRE